MRGAAFGAISTQHAQLRRRGRAADRAEAVSGLVHDGLLRRQESANVQDKVAEWGGGQVY